MSGINLFFYRVIYHFKSREACTYVTFQHPMKAPEVSEALMKPSAHIDSVSKLIIHNLICSDKVISSRHTAPSAAIILLPSRRWCLAWGGGCTNSQTQLCFKSKLKNIYSAAKKLTEEVRMEDEAQGAVTVPASSSSPSSSFPCCFCSSTYTSSVIFRCFPGLDLCYHAWSFLLFFRRFSEKWEIKNKK